MTVPFDRIVGHDRVLEPLRRALIEDRLHPSLLFHGPDGVGKRLTAFALAAAWNCPRSPGEGCGDCSSCRRTMQGYEEQTLKGADAKRAPGHHADVLYYPPRRRQIVIDQIHDLRHEAALRPFEGRRRVFILDPADRMNREASNALLKTLEEPPPSTCIVLITASPEALLPTIRSRCQGVRFAPLASDDLARLLVDQGRSDDEARRIARIAAGRVGRAREIDLPAHDRLRARVLDALESAGRGDALLQALGLANEAGASGEAFVEHTAMLLSILRDVVLLQRGAPDDAPIHIDQTERLTALAARYGARAPDALDRIEEGLRRTRGNVNPRIAAEAILVPLITSP